MLNNNIILCKCAHQFGHTVFRRLVYASSMSSKLFSIGISSGKSASSLPVAAEIVVVVVGVLGLAVVAVPGAPGTASNVLLTGGYTFVQLVLHHALFRTHTKKFAESAAQPGFLVVVVTPSSSGRRPLPLLVVRRVAAGSEVPA
jgi:hypothetical protein